MKYISYYLSWCAVVFSVSFFYKFFWDVFYSVYFQKYEVLNYGFNPSGMPPFNWKINLLIWLSGIVLMGVTFGLIMDGVCKNHYKSKRTMPLWIIVLNNGFALGTYIFMAVLSDYFERLYYMPIFFCEIIESIVPGTVTEQNCGTWYLGLTVIHGVTFVAISVYFYLCERKKQHRILEREEEFRKEMEKKA